MVELGPDSRFVPISGLNYYFILVSTFQLQMYSFQICYKLLSLCASACSVPLTEMLSPPSLHTFFIHFTHSSIPSSLITAPCHLHTDLTILSLLLPSFPYFWFQHPLVYSTNIYWGPNVCQALGQMLGINKLTIKKVIAQKQLMFHASYWGCDFSIHPVPSNQSLLLSWYWPISQYG